MTEVLYEFPSNEKIKKKNRKSEKNKKWVIFLKEYTKKHPEKQLKDYSRDAAIEYKKLKT